VDAVGTLWGRCVQLANLIILGVFRGDPTARWFMKAVQTLWHRRLVLQGIKLCIAIKHYVISFKESKSAE